MSLSEVSRRDRDAWMDALQAASAHLDADDGFVRESSGTLIYDDRLDQPWAKTGGSPGVVWARFDPLLDALDFGVGTLNETYNITGTSGPDFEFYMGQWDRDLNVQRYYGVDPADNHRIQHVDPSGIPFELAVPSYSDDNWRAAGVRQRASTGGVQNGQRVLDASHVQGFVVFEGAEPATWPAGYMLQASSTVREGGQDFERVLCQVDLADEGGATGPPGGHGQALIVPTACFYSDSIGAPVHPTAHAGPIGGFDVQFNGLQFAPDPDSTLPAPKGRLFMFGHRGEISQDHREPAGAPAAGTVYNKFVKIIEWNPTGKDPTTGNVSRVNLRELLVTRTRFTENATIGSGGIGLGVGGDIGLEKLCCFFHPPTETIRYVIDTGLSGSDDGHTTGVVFSLTPALLGLSVPSAINRAETGKTVTYQTQALGDLGEKISGHDVDWTLDRRSTLAESLTNPGDAGAVAVANFPIDGESATDNTLIVYEADTEGGTGTPLTVAVDYTVVLATGVITGLTPKFDPSKFYTADYEHSTKAATPPHGILRITNSRTDATGAAISRIEVPDDDSIATQFDGLDASSAP